MQSQLLGQRRAGCRRLSCGARRSHSPASAALPDRQRQNPPANDHIADDAVHQVRRRLRHAPGPARGAKAAPLAKKGDQLVVAVVAMTQAQEGVNQDAALMKGFDLALDQPRQPRQPRPQSAQTRSRRAAASGGKSWSVPGGGARSRPGRHSAPAWTAGRWLACEAPKGVSPHGLKPRLTPQSPAVPPTCVCPVLRGHLRGTGTDTSGCFDATFSGPRMSQMVEAGVGRRKLPRLKQCSGFLTSVWKLRPTVAAVRPAQAHRRARAGYQGRAGAP